MFLEAILYFFLGFLCAALLALMVSPAIWNRAVVLTRKRIESSIPLTLNEIQADKDQLRAEFAMSTRRLEMSVEDLRSKASDQLIEINRRRDEVNKLDSESTQRFDEVQKLEKKSTELATKLSDREQRLSNLNEVHDRLQEEHDALLSEVAKLRTNFSNSEQNLKSREIELSASSAAIESLKTTVSAIDMSENQQIAKIGKLQTEVQKQKERVAEEKNKVREIKVELKASEKQARSLVKEIEKKSKDVGQYRASGQNRDKDLSKLTSELIDEKAKTVELEAKLAQQALQTEALLNDASNENVQVALRNLNEELDARSSEAQSLRKERDKIAAELEAVKSVTTDSWTDERQEKAYLRQRINDLAAQVATMAAGFEGDESKILELLNEEEGSQKDGNSLADRIRAIQGSASGT